MDSCKYCKEYHHEVHICDAFVESIGKDSEMKSANVMEYENAVGAAANYHTDEGWGLGKPIDEQHCYDSFMAGVSWSERNSPVIKRLESALKFYSPSDSYDYDKTQGANYIWNDQGKHAREALAYLNEIREGVK